MAASPEMIAAARDYMDYCGLLPRKYRAKKTLRALNLAGKMARVRLFDWSEVFLTKSEQWRTGLPMLAASGCHIVLATSKVREVDAGWITTTMYILSGDGFQRLVVTTLTGDPHFCDFRSRRKVGLQKVNDAILSEKYRSSFRPYEINGGICREFDRIARNILAGALFE